MTTEIKSKSLSHETSSQIFADSFQGLPPFLSLGLMFLVASAVPDGTSF